MFVEEVKWNHILEDQYYCSALSLAAFLKKIWLMKKNLFIYWTNCCSINQPCKCSILVMFFLGNLTSCQYQRAIEEHSTLLIVTYVMGAICVVCVAPLVILFIQWQMQKCKKGRERIPNNDSRWRAMIEVCMWSTCLGVERRLSASLHWNNFSVKMNTCHLQALFILGISPSILLVKNLVACLISPSRCLKG